MKGTAILIASAIALVNGSILRVNKNGCPLDIKIEKLIPHEICNKYYHCTHGELLEKNCAGNLLFNELTQECDWPHDVSCGSRIIEEVQSNTNNVNENEEIAVIEANCDPSEAPTLCAAAGSDGTLVAHERCDRFYKCAEGIPVAIQCQSGLLYNPQLEVCDWPQNVHCGERTITVDEDSDEDQTDNSSDDNDSGNNNGGNCDPSEAPALCAAAGSDGTLVAHERCDRFYKCAEGIPVAIQCQSGLLYNPQLEVCDWPQNVHCGERTITVDEDSDEDQTDNSSDDNDSGNNNGGNCDPSEAPALCAAAGSDGTLVAHERCDRFYKCAEGIPVAIQCQSGLLYNPQLEVCDWPQNVHCGERTITVDEDSDEDQTDNSSDDNDSGNNNGGNCDPSEAPALCAAAGSDGTLVAHERCDRFYKCAEGIPVAIQCQSGLLYNPQLEVCDWPQNVHCGERTITVDEDSDEDQTDNSSDDNDSGNNNGGNCDPSEAPALCAAAGSDGTLVAHERCDRFYKCAEGIPVAIQCQSGLLYNPQLEVCDWPQNVHCGERTITVDEDSDEDQTDNSSDDNDSGNNNGGNCDPSEAPALCAAAGSDGTLVAHERCDRFYKCAEGIPVAIQCQSGLLYNPQLEVCDWPQNVHCGERTITVDEDSDEDQTDNSSDDNDSGNNNGGNCDPSEAPALCAAAGSDGTLVAHERCDRFYKCAEGIPVAIQCQSGLLYNPQLEVCDWPQNVHCGERTITVDEDSDEDQTDNSSDDNDSGNNNGGNCDPSEAPALCAAAGSDGTLVAHERCDRFYKCAEGIPVAIQCQSGLLYNPQLEVCDWPQNVHCGERTITVDEDSDEDQTDNSSDDNDSGNNNGGNCDPSEAPALCAAAGSDGTLVAHERCDRFYKCAEGIPVAIQCQSGLLYNPQLEVCDWPQNVHCGERTITVDEDSDEDQTDNSSDDNDSGNNNGGNCDPSEAPALCAAAGSDGTLVAHERCDRFYKCAGGIPVAIQCQSGLLYNPQLEVCDWPQNVHCGERTITVDEDSDEDQTDNSSDDNDSGNNNGGNCDPSEAPALCAAAGSDGTLVAHERCDRFYKCAEGIPVAIQCQSGLLYNPQLEVCDWPQNVHCGERTITVDEDSDEDQTDNSSDDNDSGNNNGGNCDPSEAPALCAAAGSDGTLVAHERCDRFYKCAEGIPVAIQCQSGLLYNPQLEVCDWPQNVHCGERTITVDEDSDEDQTDNSSDDNDSGNNNGGNCDPSEAPALCAAAGSDGTLVAHERCDRFYKCAGGIPVAIQCQSGLLYNPQLEVCDWPQNVICGERTIPVEDSEEDKESADGAKNSNEENNDKVCNCNPVEAPSLCASFDSEGTLVAHERCDRFYQCAGGIPVTMKCQAGLLYSPEHEICDWPSNVNCGERTISNNEDSEENNTDNVDGDNENDSGNNNGGNCDPSEAPTLCAVAGSDGTLVAHEQCDRFYKCAGGVPVAMKCQSGLLFNSLQGICDWPSNVICGERIIIDDEDCEEDKESDNGADNSNEDNNDKVCNCNPGEAPSLCASVGSDGALVAHERCDRFYQCAGGIPVTVKCQAGLLYNPHDEICDWPSNVNCGERTIPIEDSEEDKENDNGTNNSNEDNNDKVCNCNPGEAPSLCASVGSDGALVAHERCDRFYQCAGGIPVTMKCQAGLLYNPHDEICDWPSNVNCGERTIPVEDSEEDKESDNGTNNSNEDNNDKVCNCNPGEAPSLCASVGSDGALVAHERCDRFYQCAGGIPVTMKCQAGLFYNPHDEICDWPSNVNCGERTIPVEDSEEDKENDNGTNNSNEDNNDKVCNCNPGEAPSLCASVGSDGALVAHERCDRFYQCAGGIPVTMKCQAGLFYNPHDEICDWPSNVNCGERTIPVEDSEEDKENDNGTNNSNEDNNDKVCNCNPGEAPSLCGSVGSDGALVAHERCDRFYQCAGGIPVTMKCQAGLLYNPHDEICDWPSNVNCGERTIPVEDSEEDKESDNGTNNSNEDNNDKVCNCNPGEAPSLCASVGSDGALVAHERCDRFYQCAGGIPVTMKCQAGLLYNPHDEICDWPSNVNCGERTIPVEDSEEDKESDNGTNNSNEDNNDKVCNCNPGEAPSLCASVGSDGALVAHERCDSFYQCAGGIPVTMKCQAGLLYNPHDEICDWPSNVNCGERTIPVEDSEEDKENDNGTNNSNEDNNDKVCNCNPDEAPSLCASVGSDGALVAHERCDRFYQCAGGIPVTMKCQAGLLYNPHDEICDWPSNVNCGERTIPVEDSEEDKESDNGTNNSNEDNNDKVCNCNPGEAPSLCASVGSDGALVAHERCDRFYQCAGGIPVTMKCQAGLLYNPHDEICDWPSNVNCGERTIPVEDSEEDKENDNGTNNSNEDNNDKVCNCNPGEAPSLCASVGSDGALVAHERCDRFYQCAGGIPVTMKCQAGLLYNPHDEICDWPSNVNCGERTIPVEDSEEDKESDNGTNNSNEDNNDKVCNCNPGEAPSLCASVGSDGALVAHERCDRFYQCAGGIPVTMKCQAGLLYNPHDEICDWPSNVNCGERTIPVEDSEEDKENDNGTNNSNEDNNDKVCNCNPGEAPSLCASVGSDGALVAHERCDRFYQCAGGIPVTMKCQAGLLYNPHHEICDWPSNVNCGERTIVEEDSEEDKTDDKDNGSDSDSGNNNGGNCDPSEAPALCATPGSDGTLVAHERCDRFYKCAGGIPVALKCQAGLLYNPQYEICDWPQNVNCDERTIPVDESEEDRNDENDNNNKNSNEDNNDIVCNCNPGKAPSLCASVGSDGALVAHERCDRFYKCAGGSPVTMKCQAGLLYNPYHEICDWPSNVNCGERTISIDEDSEEDKTDNSDFGNIGGNCDPSEAPALCLASGSDGTLVAHERCDRFYKCAGGIPVAIKCQLGLLYNSPQQICDWPQNVDCGERTISNDEDSDEYKTDDSVEDNDSGNNNGGNCDPSEAPALCAATGSDGVLVAHERCDRFYKCAEGIPFELHCQIGLLYNPQQEICDWPSNVYCGNRLE